MRAISIIMTTSCSTQRVAEVTRASSSRRAQPCRRFGTTRRAVPDQDRERSVGRPSYSAANRFKFWLRYISRRPVPPFSRARRRTAAVDLAITRRTRNAGHAVRVVASTYDRPSFRALALANNSVAGLWPMARSPSRRPDDLACALFLMSSPTRSRLSPATHRRPRSHRPVCDYDSRLQSSRRAAIAPWIKVTHGCGWSYSASSTRCCRRRSPRPLPLVEEPSRCAGREVPALLSFDGRPIFGLGSVRVTGIR